MINIHDVLLAQMFAQRIVGLRLGEVVYDGEPDGLTADVLTEIYGEEDWSQTIQKDDESDENTAELSKDLPVTDAAKPAAGLTT